MSKYGLELWTQNEMLSLKQDNERLQRHVDKAATPATNASRSPSARNSAEHGDAAGAAPSGGELFVTSGTLF